MSSVYRFGIVKLFLGNFMTAFFKRFDITLMISDIKLVKVGKEGQSPKMISFYYLTLTVMSDFAILGLVLSQQLLKNLL